MRALTLTIMACAATTVLGQAAAPYRGPARDMENLYKRAFQQIQLAAEAMPAGDFHFKPQADSPSFASLVRTIVDGEHAACDEVNGTPEAQRAKVPEESASKEEFIAALKAASAACDKAYGAMTVENMADLKVSGDTKRGQVSILAWNYAHNSEEYGRILAFLGGKGIKPAAPQPAARPAAAAASPSGK
jgi:hypothetical protein